MLDLLLMTSCAAFYYKAGDMVRSSGFFWAGLSVMLWLVSAYLLRLWFAGAFGSQLVLFAGFTAWNCLRTPEKAVNP